MKRFRTLLCTLAVGTLAFSACNNGIYDANPDTDNSNIGNPLNVGDLGGTAGGSGYIKANFTGTVRTFNPANWVDTSGLRMISGTTPDGHYGISFMLAGYSGAGYYNATSFMYTVADGSGSVTMFSLSGTDTMHFSVYTDDGNNMVGNFYGTAVQSFPSGTFNFQNIYDGAFDIPKAH